MDNNNRGESNSIGNSSSPEDTSPQTFRFRVNRINSIALYQNQGVGGPGGGGGGVSPILEVAEGGSPSSERGPHVTSFPLTFPTHSPTSVNSAELVSEGGGSGGEPNTKCYPSGGGPRRYSRNLGSGMIPTEATSNNMASPRTAAAPVRKFSLAGIIGRKNSTSLPQVGDFEQNNGTMGMYGKSLYRYTNDAVPRAEAYRDKDSFKYMKRASLRELHEQEKARRRSLAGKPEDEVEKPSGIKFGWIEGCLVRCLLNIWGVMLFLRLSWMVGHSGIIHSLIIIGISTVVTTITTLSMSAVSTNGEIKGGGIYYMISRSLGPEWGGAIGVMFSFANSGMAALNTVGFSESLIALFHANGIKIIDGGQNDNRIISCIAICLLQSVIIIGMEWEAKAQVGLLVILLVAMIDYIIGAFVGPMNDLEYAKGWIGLNGTLFIENLGPGYRFSEGMQQDFFTVFSIFFPAVAGIQAGASISGDLKDPGEAIPKGTLLSIFITSASYAAFALLAGSGQLREASGNVTEIDDEMFRNCTGRKCDWGLYNDFQVMELMSLFGPLIYAGCFAATLSSALSCLVSGPKTFQALCKDKVYPYLTRFGVGYGKTDDPYWSYALGFVIALIFILIADLNAIAPLISNFFMATYALLNFCVFHASLVKPVGWRPTFRYYNTWVSLIGAILCVVVMFLMSWVTALVSFGCCIALYIGVVYRKPDLNWGTSTQAQTYSDALGALHSLAHTHEHVKNYRPQILCLTGQPSSRPALVDFAYLLTKKSSLLMCGHIERSKQSPTVRKAIIRKGDLWLRDRDVKAFYVMVDNCTFDEGTQALLQATGIGKLAPNIVLMGFKTDWQTCAKNDLKEYFSAIHEALDENMAITMLRIKEGLDCSHLMGSNNETWDKMVNGKSGEGDPNMGYDNKLDYDPSDPATFPNNDHKGPPESPSSLSISNEKKDEHHHFPKFGKKRNKSADDLTANGVYRGPDGSEIPKDIVTSWSLFRTKQEKGFIDVYWLYDDGGLSLLLPYIIQTRTNWKSCKLRVFCLANKNDQIEQEQLAMAGLLSKFRIDYSDLTTISDITKRAEGSSKAAFDSLIKDFRGEPDDHPDDPNADMLIGESELMAMKEKTNRHLRLRELLMEHSQSSNLIVMTLPVPRKGVVSAPLYMAWIETLTKDMPPFLLVRGNQSPVLTFYS